MLFRSAHLPAWAGLPAHKKCLPHTTKQQDKVHKKHWARPFLRPIMAKSGRVAHATPKNPHQMGNMPRLAKSFRLWRRQPIPLVSQTSPKPKNGSVETATTCSGVNVLPVKRQMHWLGLSHSNPDMSGKNMMKKINKTFAMIVCIASMKTAIADGVKRVPVLDIYTQECASCHLAYPPALLPRTSWQKITGSLNKHFGVDADRKSTRLNSSHSQQSRMPSSA